MVGTGIGTETAVKADAKAEAAAGTEAEATPEGGMAKARILKTTDHMIPTRSALRAAMWHVIYRSSPVGSWVWICWKAWLPLRVPPSGHCAHKIGHCMGSSSSIEFSV